MRCILGTVQGATARSTTNINSSQPLQQNTQINPLKAETQQSQQRARDVQARADADAQRKGKRSHDPAAEAHECVEIDQSGSGNYGAFKNTCGYPISFYSCNFRPRTIQGGFNWSADFDCSQQKTGMYTPSANGRVAAHNRNTETVHWFACKSPASPADVSFVDGQGLTGRCR